MADRTPVLTAQGRFGDEQRIAPSANPLYALAQAQVGGLRAFGANPPELLIDFGLDETGEISQRILPAEIARFHRNGVVGGEDGKRVSERVIAANWAVAIGASPIRTVACVDAWIEDFRKDIPRNDLPTMIIHGDDDRILPADATARRQAKMMKNVKYVELKGASHGLTWTRADEINAELVPFLA